MYHYKARMYSPTLGRFMQTDPIGYGDGMNMYAYVGNDPVNGVDPLGLCTWDAKEIIVCPPKMKDDHSGGIMRPSRGSGTRSQGGGAGGKLPSGEAEEAAATSIIVTGIRNRARPGAVLSILRPVLIKIFPKLRAPGLPPGVSRGAFGRAAGFGRGLDDLPTRSRADIARSAERLSELGFSRRDVANWRNFYQDVAFRNPDNLSAIHRAQVLSRIWWHMF